MLWVLYAHVAGGCCWGYSCCIQYVEEVPVIEGGKGYTVEGGGIMVAWTILKNSSCTLLGEGVG